MSKLKDPVFKNNSKGISGILGSTSSVRAYQNSHHSSRSKKVPIDDEVVYESNANQGRGILSSRDEKIRKILESTE